MHVILVLIVYIFVYWCLTRFPYQMIFMSFNSNTTSATGVVGAVCPSEAHEFNPGVCVCFPSVGGMLYQTK
jgi:hypothetical protein